MAAAPVVRTDGRKPAMMRQLKTERDPLERAHGSARWEQGTHSHRRRAPFIHPRGFAFDRRHRTAVSAPSAPSCGVLTDPPLPRLCTDRSVVMAAVYGPQQVLARKEDVDKLAIEVCWRPPFGLQTPADVERETTLRRTLEQIVLTSQMPRLGIRVVVQVIAQDGSLEACAMNATCHALMDAGIPMFGTLVAAAVAVVPGIGPCADPTEDEELGSTARGTFAYCFRGGKPGEVPKNALAQHECDVVYTKSGGSMSEEEFLGMAVLARDACVEVYMFMRAAVVEWEEDVDREKTRLEERCKAVAAAIEEHGVDGATEIFRFPYGPKGTGYEAKRKAEGEPAPMET